MWFDYTDVYVSLKISPKSVELILRNYRFTSISVALWMILLLLWKMFIDVDQYVLLGALMPSFLSKLFLANFEQNGKFVFWSFNSYLQIKQKSLEI